MQSSRGNGAKLVTKTDEDILNRICEDRSNFTAYEIAWYGVGANEGYGKNEDKNMSIDSNPVDPRTKKNKNVLDLRTRPESGGE